MRYFIQWCRYCTTLFLPVCFLFFSSADNAYSETLIAFGDSLTEGCGYSYYFDCGWQGRNDTYPLYLEQLAAENRQEIVVKNFGIGGETTQEGVYRLQTVLNDPCNPEIDFVLLLQGTNDLLFHRDVSQIYWNLDYMVDMVRARGAVPLLATVTPDPDHPWKDIYTLNDYIRYLAEQKEVLLVDLNEEMAPYWYWYTNPQGCYNDNLHPNPIGFQDMARTWYDTLGGMLKKQLTLVWLNLLLDSD